MTDDHAAFMGDPVWPKPTPQQVHALEQRYQQADSMLTGTLQLLAHDTPIVQDKTGLSDASIIFDYMLSFILYRDAQDPAAVKFTEIMCAAAFTRLVRGESTSDDLLAQYEKEIGDDNKH